MKVPSSKRRKWPLKPEQLRVVRVAVGEVLDVKLTPEGVLAMPLEDQHELLRLAGRIYRETIPASARQEMADARARQRAEADQVVAEIQADQPSAGLTPEYRQLLETNKSLLVDFVKETGRRPTPEQSEVILGNRNAAATLDDLRVPPATEPPPGAVEVFASLSRLRSSEIAELERLIEKAANEPGLFEKRRERVKVRKLTQEIKTKTLARPPRTRRHFEESGAVVIPPALVADVTREPPGLRMQDVGVAVLIFSAFEARAVPPRSGWKLEGEDLDTLVIPGQGSFWIRWDDRDRPRVNIDHALAHLVGCEWIEIVSRTNRELRIRKGSRAREADARRPDVS